jgi:hypothetical protein
MNHLQLALNLVISTKNIKLQYDAMYYVSYIKWLQGDYSAVHGYIYENQRLPRITADFYREAGLLWVQALCWRSLGHYNKGLSLCRRARDLLALCGMYDCRMDRFIMNTQSQLHEYKTEYAEACKILTPLLQEACINQDIYIHAATLLNIIEMEIIMDKPQVEVQKNIDQVKSVFQTHEDFRILQWCNVMQASLNFREGDVLSAKALFQSVVDCSWGMESERLSFCLDKLSDISYWSTWPTVFLAHSIKSREWLGIHKALKSLAKMTLDQADEDTATALFTVALEGFTQMDIHLCRAECMLHLGDIFKTHNNLVQAVELWKTARPLFERSSHAKYIVEIDKRLSSSDNIHCVV